MEDTKYISNEEHYAKVISQITLVKKYLWLGTSDLKDLYVKQGAKSVPLLSLLARLIKQGVDIRLIHAKEPGANFKNDFDKLPILWSGLERMLCPRVHFKLLIFDGKFAYIGSANLTGAGIGMKNDKRRNFETGIFTSDGDLVEQAMNQFDDVWIGKHCKSCDRKQFCSEILK